MTTPPDRGAGRRHDRPTHTIKWPFKEQAPADPAWFVATKPKDDLENELDILMYDFMRLNDVHNAQLAIASQGNLKVTRAYTLLDSEPSSTLPQTADDSKFLLASCSKAFCAAAIFSIFPSEEDRNALLIDVVPSSELSSPLGKGWDKITIQHLIDHKAGFLKEDSGDWTYDMRGLAREVGKNTGSVMTAQEFLLDFSRWKVNAEPGTIYSYSNAGYVILSRVVEIKSNKSYFDFLKDFDFGSDLAVMPTREEDFKAVKNENIITPTSKEAAGPPSWDCSKQADNIDHWEPAQWGGDGMVKEACHGSASICCSAATLAKMIGKHAVWGVGPRAPRSSRMGSTSGAFSFASSRSKDEIDFAFTMNTRSFYGGRELALQPVVRSERVVQDLIFSAEDTIASGKEELNPIHQLITKYLASLKQ